MGNLLLPKNMTRSDVMLNMGRIGSASSEEVLAFLSKLYYKTESAYQVLFDIERAIESLKDEKPDNEQDAAHDRAVEAVEVPRRAFPPGISPSLPSARPDSGTMVRDGLRLILLEGIAKELREALDK